METLNLPVAYTSPEGRERAIELVEGALVLIDKADKFTVIADENQAAMLGEFRARVAKHITDLDKQRLAMTEDLRAAQAAINAEFNGPITELRGRVLTADAMLTKYLREKREREEAERRAVEEEQRRRDAAAAQARREHEEQAAQAQRDHEAAVAAAAAANAPPPPEPVALPPPPPPPAPIMAAAPPPSAKIRGTFGSSVGLKEKWTYEITDIKKVPEQYLVAAEDRVQKGMLSALAKGQKEKAKVAGIRFFDAGGINTRVTT